MSAALPLSSDDSRDGNENDSPCVPSTMLDRLRFVREVISNEASALADASKQIGPSAVVAAERSAACVGNVIVTGIGKAGLVGQKLVATLASTGTPAHFLHPTEALHGDFGRVQKTDIVWAMSNSGRSEEVVRVAAQLHHQSSGLISFTAGMDNPLAEIADCKVTFGKHTEADPNGLAPTSSTSVMMATGDAVAMLASRLRSFSSSDFARFHPGGALGRKMSTVGQLMRPLEGCRVATDSKTIRQCMIACSIHGRRTGAVMLTGRDGVLTGLFTDSDLARLLESRCEHALDEPIHGSIWNSARRSHR